MNDLMEWLGDVFYIEQQEVTHSEGYTSERYTYSSSTGTIQLPYEDTTTVTRQVVNVRAVGALVFVVLTFVTVVTLIKGAITR